MPSPKIPKSTPKEIDKQLKEWKKLEDYREQEGAVQLVFQTWPENKNIKHILAKVSILNDFFGLHIIDTYTVAKQVLKRNIDNPLKKDDENIVNEIASITMRNGRPRRMYAFASKYCSHHQPNHFPIYDYFVEKVLIHWRENSDFGKFHDFTNQSLKDYPKFKKTIDKFIEYFKLGNYTYKEIDIYLWLTGKKYFPRRY